MKCKTAEKVFDVTVFAPCEVPFRSGLRSNIEGDGNNEAILPKAVLVDRTRVNSNGDRQSKRAKVRMN